MILKDGINYLAPVDSEFKSESQMKYHAYPLNLIMDHMEKSNALIKILILDACRDNPFQKTRGIQSGLAPVYAPKGTILAFSTSPGERAKDGGAGRNSLYTGALLTHIDDENIQIEEFFKRVRTTVHTVS